MSVIPITNDQELKRLFDRLVTDIVDAGGYARLCRGLGAALPEYEKEIAQSRAFWNFTAQALREGCLLRLARIYDQERHSLSLFTLLHTIGHHARYFEDDSVLRRVSAVYAEEFKAGSHRIDRSQFAGDIRSVSGKDPLVQKLIVWRSNFGAHLSTKPILKAGIRGRDPLTEEDVFTLVARAFEIYNRYLTAFEATSFATKIIGEDDYSFLLQLLRLGLAKFEADMN